jgi:predicted transcriptional regulator
MKANKETTYDLARIIGVPQSAVSLRLNGKRDFRLKEVQKITKHYNKKFEELF